MAFKEKRLKMEKTIYTFFSKLDPTESNTKKYKSFFSKMTDAEFKKFFDKFFNDPSEYLILDIVGYEIEPTIDNIKKAADYLGVPLFEYIMQPNITRDMDGKPVTTKAKIPVGYIHMKCMQQLVRKKSTHSTSIDIRDPRTGQVMGEDKDTQFSIDENYGLMAVNAQNCLKEFLSFRADDMVMKQEAYANIRKNGYVALGELTDNIENKVAVNTTDVYITGMHIKTDMVNPGYITNRNLTKK